MRESGRSLGWSPGSGSGRWLTTVRCAQNELCYQDQPDPATGLPRAPAAATAAPPPAPGAAPPAPAPRAASPAPAPARHRPPPPSPSSASATPPAPNTPPAHRSTNFKRKQPLRDLLKNKPSRVTIVLVFSRSKNGHQTTNLPRHDLAVSPAFRNSSFFKYKIHSL